ncbi:glycosyltransferase family 2 protein [Mucilaginibacter sp. dw_454]|uniref:glycosyltransferase family 2 protein n=1 Tax=Mucilaginibacter sp. dw_454 TaxID=2720079 RepID=UPI001BD4B2C6|nr:glycosyltransferase family 2 protein [Mucilaginibacter sp. dw_454]
MPKAVALILLNWNTPVYTDNCIASLKQYCNEALFDIIVADNGSTDNSLEILKAQYPDLIYIDNKENLGFAEGNNRALRYSIEEGYTYSLLLNTDTLVDEDIVFKLRQHLDKHAKGAAVQPAIYWMHDHTSIWNGKGSFNKLSGNTPSSKKLPDPGLVEGFEQADWVTGCCVLLRNDALQKGGLLNKRFFLYYEDVDLSFRLRECGYELHYLPDCKMYHEAGASATSKNKEGSLSPIIHYYVCRNHIWILRRYGNALFYPVNLLYNGAYYLSLLAYFILRRRKQKAGFLIKAFKDGFFTPKNLIWAKDNTSIS